jgi:hypothetical protein
MCKRYIYCPCIEKFCDTVASLHGLAKSTVIKVAKAKAISKLIMSGIEKMLVSDRRPPTSEASIENVHICHLVPICRTMELKHSNNHHQNPPVRYGRVADHQGVTLSRN